MVDAEVRKWLDIVEEGVFSPEGFNHAMHHMAEFFYADYALQVLNQLVRLQLEFDILTGLFEWVGLNMDMEKMASMV